MDGFTFTIHSRYMSWYVHKYSTNSNYQTSQYADCMQTADADMHIQLL